MLEVLINVFQENGAELGLAKEKLSWLCACLYLSTCFDCTANEHSENEKCTMDRSEPDSDYSFQFLVGLITLQDKQTEKRPIRKLEHKEKNVSIIAHNLATFTHS